MKATFPSWHPPCKGGLQQLPKVRSRVPKHGVKIKPHTLDSEEHHNNSLRIHLKMLGGNKSNGVGHMIITHLGIYQGNSHRYPALLRNVGNQMSVHSNLNGFMVLVASIDLTGNPVIAFSLLHHTFGIHETINKVQISFHQKNCAQFVNLENALLLLKHHGESRLPSLKRRLTSNSQFRHKGMDLTQKVTVGSSLVMPIMQAGQGR